MKLGLIHIEALVLLLVAGGCATSRSRYEPLPQYFVCNRWTDDNHNGRIEPNEFEGVNRTAYHASEQVTFVCHFPGRAGTRLDWAFRDPKGRIIAQQSSSQVWAATCLLVPVRGAELISRGGTGRWQVDWFSKGKRIGTSEANIEQ